VPGEQAPSEELCDEATKCPVLAEVQDDAPAPEKVPTGQGVGEVEPAAAYIPAILGKQDIEPITELKVPAGH
jgi:hypothetical protein